MCAVACECGQMAEGGLFWYVDFVMFAVNWCWVWCVLCVWNCAKRNYDEKLGIDGVWVFGKSEIKRLKSYYSGRNQKVRYYFSEKSDWKCLW